ncbi:MAG: hypothetical protein IKU13_06955, partial [Clostridia bacterium]|nr:hypothetical protein [Clostridia bacterium]
YGKEWVSGLSKEEKASIHAYTGTAYANINKVLRGEEKDFEPGNREHASNIHRVLSQASIPNDCVVYRGVSGSALGSKRFLPDSMLVGHSIQDSGFMSTSLDPRDAFQKEILLEIEVPKGAPGVYVGDISAAGHYESEVLFDKDLDMVIISVRRDENGRRIIRTRMRGNW